MSNDAKFWAARFGLAFYIFVFVTVILKAAEEARKSAGGEPAHVALWLALFALFAIASIPLGFVYLRLKNRRWDETAGKTQSQVEVETLNKLAEQQKEKTKR